MKEIKTTVRIREIEEIKKHREKIDKEIYRLKGTDTDGVGKVTLELPSSFDGFRPPAVIDVIIRTSQTSLSDFKKEEKDLKEKKQPVDPLSKKKK